MRKLGLIALGIALASLFACDSAAPPAADPEVDASSGQSAATGTNAAAEAQAAQAYDRLELLQREMEQARLEFEELLPSVHGLPQPMVPIPHGYLEQLERGLPLRESWMNCSRYLTNNASAGFCEDRPPASWRPFMFNDERYFLVPLGPSA